jgi:hypothetical protein
VFDRQCKLSCIARLLLHAMLQPPCKMYVVLAYWTLAFVHFEKRCANKPHSVRLLAQVHRHNICSSGHCENERYTILA